MFSSFSCAILWLEVVMPPKRRRSTGPLRASVVEVLTPRDSFVNQQRISCKIPWYSAKGNPTTANDIVVPTTSTKVSVTGCLHHHFHTSSRQLLNSTSSDSYRRVVATGLRPQRLDHMPFRALLREIAA